MPTMFGKTMFSKPTETETTKEKEDYPPSEVSAEPQHRPPPDGGFVAWAKVACVFLGLFAVQGYGYSWGVFLRHYNTEVYPDQLTALTWIGSLWNGLCTLTGPIYFWTACKFGDRRVVAFGGLLCVLGMMLGSITNTVWQLYLTQGVLSGLGASLAWYSCVRMPLMWFDKHRGLATGIVMSSSGVGGLAMSNIINASIDALGYRWALRILGFIQFALVSISVFGADPLNPLPKKAPLIDVKDFKWKNKQYLLLMVIHFFGNFAFYMPSAFVPSYANYHGMSNVVGANLSAIMSAFMFVGKISVGYVGDYVGRYNMGIICGVMVCIAHLAVWMTATVDASMWVFAVLYGIFGGGYIATITAVTADVVPEDRVETANGWAFFFWSFGGFFSQPIAASIVERTAEPFYKGAIIFSGVLFLAGGCLCLIMRVLRGGWKVWQKI